MNKLKDINNDYIRIIQMLLGNLDLQLKTIQGNIFNMIVFDKLKTGDPILDGILTTVVLTVITLFFQYIHYYFIDFIDFLKNIEVDYLGWFQTKYTVEYDGKMSLTTNFYDSKLNNTYSFSDRFKALWLYIIENVGNNSSIKTIKEFSFENE